MPLFAANLNPGDLIDRLLDVHQVKSPEHLGNRGHVSLRTLRRWQKDGFPAWWPKMLNLLDDLDLLRRPEDPVSLQEKQDRLVEAVATAIETQAELAEDLAALTVKLNRILHLLGEDHGEPPQDDPVPAPGAARKTGTG